MFDHVTIRVSEVARSRAAYAAVLGTLGHEPAGDEATFVDWGGFSIAPAGAGPVTQGLHVGFAAPSRDDVERFWRAGRAAGLPDDGAPGPRPQYLEDYYGGFLRDPDGNSIEAVHHGRLPAHDIVDHVWLRVRDVDRALAFWALVADHAGLVAERLAPGHVILRGPVRGSLSLVAGTPSEHVHLAFPAAGPDQVDAFHAAATAAGHPDHGAPGERPEYHRGYYGAFVLDPDGTNVELVHHGARD